jgi:hypothetical protein
MLVATFGPTTTWVGKTVTYTDGVFVLEGHGPISAQDVFEYERQGHLIWSMDGIRAWVGARAQAAGGPAATPSQASEWQAGRPAETEAGDPRKAERGELSAEPPGAVAEPRGATVEPQKAVEHLPELDVDADEQSDEAASRMPAAVVVDPVLAAEPAELAEIAASSGLAVAAAVAGQISKPGPAEPPTDESEEPVPDDPAASTATPDDAFSGLGADDPARARAIEEAARDHDWARLTALYELQAWWLDEEGRDALQVTRLARRAELRALAARGVARIRVAAADDERCAACRRVGERVMTVADALRLMPIPNASCAYKWCRCRWEPANGDAPQ